MIQLQNGMLRLLDCTLRDGGQCLESNQKHGIKTEVFTDAEKILIAEKVRDSKADIVEIGCISEVTGQNKKNIAIYTSVEELSAYLPTANNSNQIYTGVFVDPEIETDHIPPCSKGLIDGARIILRYSELRRSLDFCSMLKNKGYRVFIQPMLTMRYSDSDIQLLIDYANDMDAEALYIVDSFGYMMEEDIKRIYDKYENGLTPKISIGLHAHNNMECALTNVRYFIENVIARDGIVDTCAMGMGQGAGNLQTEVLVNYLNTKYGSNYDINKIFDVCDILEKFVSHNIENWGYSPLRFIPAIHQTAYKYAIAMKMEYDMSLAEINNTLTNIPEEIRHRYTPGNIKMLLENVEKNNVCQKNT